MPPPHVRWILLLLFTPDGALVLDRAPRRPVSAARPHRAALVRRCKSAPAAHSSRRAADSLRPGPIPPHTTLGSRQRALLLPGAPQPPGTLFSRRRRPSIPRVASD
ncbi:hypothetical protein NDU88_001328 [Pleurodeles waltl]|uniref:Secreted protein n=1 Tax=Pleurodeles waltl TaxID=8319 RepID=A0AAV7MNE1_PLEWA|nr:hypothetical protein NDU88_001328 [Pleurodeles waltl]